MLRALVVLKKDGVKIPRLAVFGKGSLESKLREIVQLDGLGEDVYFGGFIKPSEVPLYTEVGDVVPVLYLGKNANNRFASPNKLFEAIAAGKPVIVNDVGILGDATREEGIGLVVNGEDPADIARGIRRLTTDKRLYVKLVKNSKKASRRYNWENEGKKLLRLISSL